MPNANSDSVFSFFSGAGGFSYGFTQAGLRPVSAAEINVDACKSYEANIGSECHTLDLSITSPEFFSKIAGGKKPFVVIGGPPCQGFSTAGARSAKDPRNKLIFNYLNIVRELSPRWFVFENVEGLLTSGGGEALASLLREFIAIGYSVRVQKVNLAAFGVPQTRKRVLIIGNRLGADFEFPDELYSYDSGKSKKDNGKPLAPTVLDALAGLPTPSREKGVQMNYLSSAPINKFDASMREGNDEGLVTLHAENTSEADRILFSLLKGGQTMKDLPQEYWHESFARRAFRRVADGTPTEKRGGAPSGIKRLHGKLQSLTITGAATREFIHPIQNRSLSIRECARIQTFPDRYHFMGNSASVIQQIGNAVPPMAAKLIALHLKKIDGQFGSGLKTNGSLRAPRLLGYVLTEAAGMSEALTRTRNLLDSFKQDFLSKAH